VSEWISILLFSLDKGICFHFYFYGVFYSALKWSFFVSNALLRCWLATSRLLQRSSFKTILNSKEIAEHLIYLWHFNWLFSIFFL
jgi:hypothetical protein